MSRSREEIWAQISSVPIVWEDRSATLNFVRDITIQKKAEEELRNSLEKLRKITGATIQAMAQTVEVRDPYTPAIKNELRTWPEPSPHAWDLMPTV